MTFKLHDLLSVVIIIGTAQNDTSTSGFWHDPKPDPGPAARHIIKFC
eukprot:gene4145-14596_t